jgi:hypothetical protein
MDQAKYPFVCYPVFQKLHHPLMVDVVEPRHLLMPTSTTQTIRTLNGLKSPIHPIHSSGGGFGLIPFLAAMKQSPTSSSGVMTTSF